MSNEVYAERNEGIATVVLNRPDKLNAMDGASWLLLGEVMNDLDSDDDIRCVVVLSLIHI